MREDLKKYQHRQIGRLGREEYRSRKGKKSGDWSKTEGWSEKNHGGEGSSMSALVVGDGEGQRESEQMGEKKGVCKAG